MPATRAERGFRAASFMIRHAVAAAVVIAGVLLFTAVSYFGLLLWAVLAGEPLGGPIALPFLLMLAAVVSVVVVGVLFLVCASAELVCAKIARWPWVMQIPVSTILLALLLVGGGALLDPGSGEAGASSFAFLGVVVTCALLVPLGAYFWSMRSAGWLLSLGRSVIAHVRSRLVSTPTFR